MSGTGFKLIYHLRRHFKFQLINLVTYVQLDHATCLSQICLEICQEDHGCTSKKNREVQGKTQILLKI